MGWILDVDVHTTTKTKAQALLLFLSFSLSSYYYTEDKTNKKHHSQSRQISWRLDFRRRFLLWLHPLSFWRFEGEFFSQLFGVCETHLMCYVCVCVSVSVWPARPNIFHTSWKKKLCNCSADPARRCLIPTLCSPSFLIGSQTLSGSSTPNPFFFPRLEYIIKIDANEFIFLVLFFGLSNFKLSNEMRIGFQSAGCRIFQFDSLRFAFVFYRTSCCTQSWSITSFLFVFHVLNVLCYLIVVFSLFFWRRKTWETQTNKKPIFPSFSW